MNTTVKRPCTPVESLKQSLIEMKLIRQGKIKKQSFWDMMKHFDNEDDEE